MSDPHGRDAFQIERARFDALGNRDLYDILRLRSEVFVIEQDCVYLDLDGRDAEPATEHLWVRDARGIVATLRLLDEGDGVWSIGRVVTRPDARSSGVGSRLLEEATALLEARGCTAIVLGAQSHLSEWYRRFGYEVDGAEYVEDGIPHVPMRRRSTTS